MEQPDPIFNVCERHERLNIELKYHNHRYYCMSDPVISDAQYDKMYRELEQIEKAHPELETSESVTQIVGCNCQSGTPKSRQI